VCVVNPSENVQAKELYTYYLPNIRHKFKLTKHNIAGDVLLVMLIASLPRVLCRNLNFGQFSMPQKRTLSLSLEGAEQRAPKIFAVDPASRMEASDEKLCVRTLETPDKSYSDKKSYR
jgi:hypothetical protein